jgi:hypothetical protein
MIDPIEQAGNRGPPNVKPQYIYHGPRVYTAKLSYPDKFTTHAVGPNSFGHQ